MTDPAPTSVPCPYCRAAVGEPCMVRARRRLAPAPHPMRVTAARTAVATPTANRPDVEL